MDPKIRNFDTIEEFIREHPREAQLLVAEWENFVKENPEFAGITDVNQWYEKISWSAINPALFVGKEIQDAYSYIQPDSQAQQVPQPLSVPSNPMEILSLATPLLLLLQEPTDLMEDHPGYKKIQERKKQEWLKNNPGKDFSSKEGLDYLYGTLDGQDTSVLAKETEKEFRDKNPKTSKKYDERKKKQYDNFEDDPIYQRAVQQADNHAEARYTLFKSENPGLSKTERAKKRQELKKRTLEKQLDIFVESNEEKATAYAKQDQRFAAALHRKYVRDLIKAQKKYQIVTSGDPQLSLLLKQQKAREEISQIRNLINSVSPDPNQLAKKNSFWQRFKESLKKKQKTDILNTPPPPRRQSSAFTRTLGRGFQAINIATNPRAAATQFVTNQAIRQVRKRFLTKLEEKLAKYALQQAGRVIGLFAGGSWIPIVAVFLVLIFSLLMIGWSGGPTSSSSAPTPPTQPIPGFDLNLSSTTFDIGVSELIIDYKRDPTSPVSLDKITISIELNPPTLTYQSATDNPVCNPSPCGPTTQKVTWSLAGQSDQEQVSIRVKNSGQNDLPVTVEAEAVI